MTINDNGVQVERQYIGARYVPKFFQGVNGSPEWVSGLQYEPLTIVTYLGNSFTSKIPVPAGVGNPADNPMYWANTGNLNPQIDDVKNQLETVKDTISLINNEIENIDNNITDLSNKINSIIFKSVKQYGAVGDGITDDTSAIQSALNDYSHIYFPEGVYLVSENLTLTNNHIFGTLKSVIKRKENNLNNYYILHVNTENCIIENIIIEGDRDTHLATTGEWGMGIEVDNDNCLINNCIIRNTWGDGVYIYANNCTVSNCKIQKCSRNGISVTKGNNFKLLNNTIEGINRTAPMFAIDIEPNTSQDRVYGVIDGLTSNRNGCGAIALGMKNNTNYFDVKINNVFSQNDGQSYVTGESKSYGVIRINTSDNTYVGTVEISNVSIRQHYCQAIVFNISTYIIINMKNVVAVSGQSDYIVEMGGTRNNTEVEMTISYPGNTAGAIFNNLSGSKMYGQIKLIGNTSKAWVEGNNYVNIQINKSTNTIDFIEHTP